MLRVCKRVLCGVVFAVPLVLLVLRLQHWSSPDEDGLRVRAGSITGGVTSGVGITRPESNLDHALVVFLSFSAVGFARSSVELLVTVQISYLALSLNTWTRRALQRCTPTAQPRSLSALSNVSDVTSRGTHCLPRSASCQPKKQHHPRTSDLPRFRIWLALAMGKQVSPRHNAAVILAQPCLGLHSVNESVTWRQRHHCSVGRFRWTSPRFAYHNSQVSSSGKVMLILHRGQTYDALGAISPAQRICHYTTFLWPHRLPAVQQLGFSLPVSC